MIGSVGDGWSDERVAAMKERYAAGDSCSQIAKHLGWVSRNAVIGKLHRLGLIREPVKKAAPRLAPRAAPRPPTLPAGAHPWRQAPAKTRVASNGARTYALPEDKPLPRPIRAVPADARPVTIHGLGFGMCRWPINEAPAGCMDQTLFCAAPTEEGATWCAYHHSIGRTAAPKPTTFNPDFNVRSVRNRTRAA